MGRYKGVDPSGGSSKLVAGVGEESAQDGTEEDPAIVESEELESATPAALGELQGHADHQLHHHVEHQVKIIYMDKLVGQEPPSFLPSFWIIEKKREPWRTLGVLRILMQVPEEETRLE